MIFGRVGRLVGFNIFCFESVLRFLPIAALQQSRNAMCSGAQSLACKRDILKPFHLPCTYKEYCHESPHHAGTTCIADRRGAYSDDAQAAELHRRGIFDRHRHIGTGKMKFPMQRLLSQKINFV